MPRKSRVPKRVLSAIQSTAWAITEPALREILEVASRQTSNPEAMALLQQLIDRDSKAEGLEPTALGEQAYSRPLDNTQATTVRDGVATIPITGKLFRYGNMMTAYSGCTSYECLANDFMVAMQDPGVRAILLAIDSPGGEVNGCLDLATLMAGQSGVKPIVAHISGEGCSAAYVLASVADEIVVSSMALVGCLGTAFEIIDMTEADAQLGIKTYRIVSSQTPNKNLDPATPEGRSQVQRVADAFSERMLADVAAYREMTVEALLTGSGRGDVLVGEAAVTAGLADRLATYEDVHALLDGRAPVTTEYSDPPSPEEPSARKEPDMEIKDLTRDALAAGNAALLAEIESAGATAERTRLKGIAALPAAGAEEVRTACAEDPTCSVDAAARKILEAQAAKAKTTGAARLEAVKKDETELDPPAPLASEATDGQSAQAEAQRIVGIHRRLTGAVAK